MPRRPIRILIAASALAMAGSAGAQTVDRVHAGKVSARLLDALRDANGVPGMAAAIVADGDVRWTGRSGYRDAAARKPVTDDTIFRLASVSKIVTATAAGKLREQRGLDVDAPVQTMVKNLSPGWAPITLRQLAAHISGMGHYIDADDARGNVHYPTPGDALAIFKDRPLLSPPGTQYEYSSYGYTLMSAVIEARADTSFLDYLAREITPGLDIRADATGLDPMASMAYAFSGNAAQPAAAHDFSYTWAGGGLAGSARDLARFGGRMLDNRIVSAETFRWMQQPARLADGKTVAERDFEVGFGWRTSRDIDGRAMVHHAGITIGARSVLLLYPEQKLAVSLLSNALWISAIEQTGQMIAAPFLAPAQATPGPVPCPVKATRYAGSFGDTPITGSATFEARGGICSAAIETPVPFAQWVDPFVQKDMGKTLPLIGIDARAGFNRAGLVVPSGIYDLRVQPDGSYRAELGGKRSITLRFE